MYAPKQYEKYGINIEEKGQTTHVFKNGTLIGSFTIDVAACTLKFDFPEQKFFNYFAYIANDKPSARVRWVNENLGKDTLDNLQAGVAFLGFAKFEELMALEVAKHTAQTEGAPADDATAETTVH
jgi:hypothetical protein